MAVLSWHPKTPPHCDLASECNIPVSKIGIVTVLVCLSKKNFNSFKRNLVCSRIFFVRCHVTQGVSGKIFT